MNEVTAGVRAEGLGKRYGDNWALRDVDLDVRPGTVLGLLGHNGAGKTTWPGSPPASMASSPLGPTSS
jgi:ABC-type sugar transport system ATPase subunit